MKIINNRIFLKSVSLLIMLSIAFSLLSSCHLFSTEYDGDKAAVESAVSTAVEKPAYAFVSLYLLEWNMPAFDRLKVQYFEECLQQLYNYEGGIPSAFNHAREVAELFIEHYWEEIDLNDKTLVTDALLTCYVAVLDDPYSAYRPPEETDDYFDDMSGKFGGIGVMVEYDHRNETTTVTTVYPDSPADKAGLKVGDVFYAVDGMTVDEVGYDNLVNYIRGEIGTDVELTVIRNGEHFTTTATRAEVEEINADYYIDEENNIAYIQIVSFKGNTFEQFRECVDTVINAGVEGIIFDVRNNPGGYVDSVVDVISYIIADGYPVISYQYKGRPKVTLSSEDKHTAHHMIDLPMVVLCNEYTASAGEIFAAAMRDYRDKDLIQAKIVGTNTYGKGVMQSSYAYPFDQSTMTFTVAYYNPPYGENYHGVGVTPDIIVELGDSEVDLQLEAGIEALKELINAN